MQNVKHVAKRKNILPVKRYYPVITAFRKKVLIVGDFKKIKGNKLNNSFSKAKYIMKSFSGAKIQDLKHYVTPHLEHEKPDIACI